MDSFSDQVVAEIEARGVVPKPQWQFLLGRSVFWVCAVVSILVGSVAFSVANYVFFDNGGASPASIIESPMETIIQGLPIVWLVLFGLFTVSTYLSLRKTRRGYRYRTTIIIVAVLFITICLGSFLNLFDFGQAIHYYLLHHTSFYEALINSNDDTRIPF